MTEENVETSVRAIVSCPNGGTIITSGFPGLQSSIDGDAYIDPHNLKETLSAIQSAGAKTLVILTEMEELPENAIQMVENEAKSSGLDTAHLPIPDYHAPDDGVVARWHALAADIGFADRAETIAFCCQYGAGRSGTMAAYALMQQGMSKDAAIKAIRDEFADSIESEVQLEFLERISARLKDRPADLDPD